MFETFFPFKLQEFTQYTEYLEICLPVLLDHCNIGAIISGTNSTLAILGCHNSSVCIVLSTEGGADGGDSKTAGGMEGSSVAFPPEHGTLPRLQ